jgi:hypothetical protein
MTSTWAFSATGSLSDRVGLFDWLHSSMTCRAKQSRHVKLPCIFHSLADSRTAKWVASSRAFSATRSLTDHVLHLQLTILKHHSQSNTHQAFKTSSGSSLPCGSTHSLIPGPLLAGFMPIKLHPSGRNLPKFLLLQLPSYVLRPRSSP